MGKILKAGKNLGEWVLYSQNQCSDVPFDADLPGWMDRGRAAKIAQLRALGYTQRQIADDIGVSQQTVSRYLTGIEEAAENADDREAFFLGLVLGGLGIAALIALLSSQKRVT